MEDDPTVHDIGAEADQGGVLVVCSCGWQVWSRTSPTPDLLARAAVEIGGRHLANVTAPPAPRRDVLLAVGLLLALVLVTVVAVVVIVAS